MAVFRPASGPDAKNRKPTNNNQEIITMAIQELSEQETVRRRSLETLRERGIDPYPAAEFTVTGHTD